MTTTETIAAGSLCLVAVPGTELTPACPLCDGDHTLPTCPTWNEGPALIARLRADNAKWRSLADAAARGMVNAGREVDALRSELANGHEIVAQLLSPQFDDAAYWDSICDSARAWMRREAK